MMKNSYVLSLSVGVLVGVLVMGSCDLFSDANDEVSNQILERVRNRRQQWQDQNIEDYQLIYSQQVGDVLVDSVEVFVRSRMVDSIATSQDLPEDEVLVGTVGSFFDLVEARIGEDDSQFNADFDEEQGFPTRYTADFQDDRRSQTVLTTALVDSLEATK